MKSKTSKIILSIIIILIIIAGVGSLYYFRLQPVKNYLQGNTWDESVKVGSKTSKNQWKYSDNNQTYEVYKGHVSKWHGKVDYTTPNDFVVHYSNLDAEYHVEHNSPNSISGVYFVGGGTANFKLTKK